MDTKQKEALEKDLLKITGKDIKILTYDNEVYPDFIQVWGSKIKSIKIPKNKSLITAQWILNKIDNSYTNLKPLFKQLELKGNIYYTSFGFSYDMFFKSQKDFDNDIKTLQDKLDELNINYTNELSNAGWVYRFRISKNKSNLDKINNLINK